MVVAGHRPLNALLGPRIGLATVTATTWRGFRRWRGLAPVASAAGVAPCPASDRIGNGPGTRCHSERTRESAVRVEQPAAPPGCQGFLACRLGM